MKSLPILAFLLLVFSQSSGILVRADLVDDTCMKTSNPVFCTSTLRADPGSASADVKGLARIMMRVVQTSANETFGQVENLVGQTSEAVLKAMLNDCSIEYGDSVVDSCPHAIKYFDMGLFRIAQGDMEDVAGSAESCETAFTCEMGYIPGKTFCQPRPSPLTDMNNLVHTLITTHGRNSSLTSPHSSSSSSLPHYPLKLLSLQYNKTFKEITIIVEGDS